MSFDIASYDLIDTADRLGLTLQREGKNYRTTCPHCQAVDAVVLQPNKQRYICNRCHSYGQVTNLVMVVMGCTLPDAKQWLATTGPTGQPSAGPVQARPTVVPYDANKFRHIWMGTRKRLTTDSPAGLYLASRGLGPDTWAAWGMGDGYCPTPDSPAVVLPVLDQSANFRLHGFRPVSGQPAKFMWAAGVDATGQFFGAHLVRGDRMLVVVEGCLNGPSLWQVANDLFDVVCIGSINYTPSTELLDLAHRAPGTIIFGDDDTPGYGGRVDRLAGLLHTEMRVYATLADGVKNDANHLLQAGQLREMFLHAVQSNGWFVDPMTVSLESIDMNLELPTKQSGRWSYVNRPIELRADIARYQSGPDQKRRELATLLLSYLDGKADDYRAAYFAAVDMGIHLCYGIQWGAIYENEAKVTT